MHAIYRAITGGFFVDEPTAQSCLVLLVHFCAWICFILVAPNLLFAESQRFGAVTVYAHNSLAGIEPEMKDAEAALARSPINDPAVRQRIYLTRSTQEFAWFSPNSRQALGTSYVEFGSTFLPEADPASNTVRSSRDRFNVRRLSQVITHERMHLLLAHHFGWIRTHLSPNWKQEGYCEYIAGGHSIGSEDDGLHLLAEGAVQISGVTYFRDYLRIRFLIERRGLTIDQVFAQTFDTAAIDREALATYVKRRLGG